MTKIRRPKKESSVSQGEIRKIVRKSIKETITLHKELSDGTWQPSSNLNADTSS